MGSIFICVLSGGNWNNSANAGVLAANWNNNRSNSNNNVGAVFDYSFTSKRLCA